MTDKPEKTTRIAEGQSQPSKISRRALIKGGAAAMPAILTLHSGAAAAAFARSSYTISPSSPDVTNEAGRTLCVDKSSVVYADEIEEIYDLGDPPYAEINVIRGPTEVQFYETKSKDYPIKPGAMCERGGQFWSKPKGEQWMAHDVPQGFVASSGAWTSLAAYVKDNLI